MKSKDQTLLEEAYNNVLNEGELRNPYDDPFNKLIVRIHHAKKTGDKAKKALAQSELEVLAKKHNKMQDPEVLNALEKKITNTQLIVGSNHSFKVRFHSTPSSASKLDPVIPSGTIVEYSYGDINKDFVLDREGKIIGSKYLTGALQYVPVIWNDRHGFLAAGDVKIAA